MERCKGGTTTVELSDVELTGEGVDSVTVAGKKSSETSLFDSRSMEATVLVLIWSKCFRTTLLSANITV